jgi:SAM-dependent methyltransferase
MDAYQDLSRYYDIENADLTGDLDLYLELASAAPGGPVLDVGCGTGRVAFALAAAGREVIGIDNSEAMLARARARLAQRPDLAGRVRLHAADVTRLRLDTRAALAVWAYNGFMHLTAAAEQRAALSCLAAHLLPGGRLVIDLPNPSEPFAAEHNGALTLERTFTHPETGATVLQQASTLLDRAAQLLHVTWIYDEVSAGGQVQRAVVPITLRYTFPAEMALLLELTGLRLVALYGSYARDPFDDAGERLIVLAELDSSERTNHA